MYIIYKEMGVKLDNNQLVSMCAGMIQPDSIVVSFQLFPGWPEWGCRAKMEKVIAFWCVIPKQPGCCSEYQHYNKWKGEDCLFRICCSSGNMTGKIFQAMLIPPKKGYHALQGCSVTGKQIIWRWLWGYSGRGHYCMLIETERGKLFKQILRLLSASFRNSGFTLFFQWGSGCHSPDGKNAMLKVFSAQIIIARQIVFSTRRK